jgi:magnesium-transporting ATPase (P-type)
MPTPNPAVDQTVPTARGVADVNAAAPTGLTSDEARRRLEHFGLNAMPDTSAHHLRMAFEKFWTPVPWMLEAAIVPSKLRSSRFFSYSTPLWDTFRKVTLRRLSPR